MSIIMERLLSSKRAFTWALKLDRSLDDYFLASRSAAPKDLPRCYPGVCPSCHGAHIKQFSVLPYYRTFIKLWQCSLDDYFEAVKKPYRFAAFDIFCCPDCDLIFVFESYKGLVEDVEAHPLYVSKIIKPYVDGCQLVIDDAMVKKVLAGESLSELERRFKMNYDIIGKYLGVTGKFLDLGAGMGSFAEFMRKVFPAADISCCEINGRFVEECRSRYPELRCFNRPLSDHEDTFDFIYLADVIEHIWDLDDFIGNIRQHLRKDGYVMMITPDSDSSEAKKHGTGWWPYLVPHHAQLFNQRSITAMMERLGFRLVESGTDREELWVVFQNVR